MAVGARLCTTTLRAALMWLTLFVVIAACGETRHTPGEACLRGDDCLSGFCTDRICVAAPPLGKPQTGGGGADAGSAHDDASSGSADAANADARGD